MNRDSDNWALSLPFVIPEQVLAGRKKNVINVLTSSKVKEEIDRDDEKLHKLDLAYTLSLLYTRNRFGGQVAVLPSVTLELMEDGI